jgi:thiol-disulfide isomerase/thioredoxin
MSSCYALYPSSSEVVDLNPANFDRLVTQSDAVWIVEFYAPWCGHCQQFVPEYSKAATALKVKCGVLSRTEIRVKWFVCQSLSHGHLWILHTYTYMQFQRRSGI